MKRAFTQAESSKKRPFHRGDRNLSGRDSKRPDSTIVFKPNSTTDIQNVKLHLFHTIL